MSTTPGQTVEKLTFRRYKDGDVKWDSWREQIFQASYTHKCPTYIQSTPPCQGSCPSGEDIRGYLNIVRGIEKPPAGEEPSNLRIFGRYLLTPRVMKILAQTPPGKGGEIQLTDALIALLEHEEIYAVVVDPSEGYDTGNVLAWLEANIKLGLASERYGEALRASLLTMFHPERVDAE